MSARHGKEGFTLAELLVSIVAASILLLLVGAMLWMPARALVTNKEYAQIRLDVAYSVAMLSKDIRVSSLNSVVVAEDRLLLPANTTRAYSVEYLRDAGDDSLTRVVGTDRERIVMDGLTRFRPTITNDIATGLSGVVLDVEVQNPDGEIVVEHSTFIHARN